MKKRYQFPLTSNFPSVEISTIPVDGATDDEETIKDVGQALYHILRNSVPSGIYREIQRCMALAEVHKQHTVDESPEYRDFLDSLDRASRRFSK